MEQQYKMNLNQPWKQLSNKYTLYVNLKMCGYNIYYHKKDMKQN